MSDDACGANVMVARLAFAVLCASPTFNGSAITAHELAFKGGVALAARDKVIVSFGGRLLPPEPLEKLGMGGHRWVFGTWF